MTLSKLCKSGGLPGGGLTPSQQCKAAGLKSLAALARISGESPQTLINWHRDKPKRFALVLAGSALIHQRQALG